MFDRASEEPRSGSNHETDSHVSYLEAISLVEGLHRLRLEVVKDELRRIGVLEVTPAQALLLFGIGHNTLTASELVSRGCHQSSNVSYTISKLAKSGFLCCRRYEADGRSVLISLTERGRSIRDLVAALFERHVDEMDAGRLDLRRLEAMAGALRSLERFWIEQRLHERL